MTMNSLDNTSALRKCPRSALAPLLFALALAAAPPAARAAAQENAPAGLDLGQVLGMAQASDPEVKQAEAAVQKSQARLLQNKAAYFPSIKLGMEYSHTTPNDAISVPGFGSAKTAPDNSYDYHLALEQELFSFGRDQAKVSAGKWEVKAARSALAQARERTAFQAVQLFYSILLLQQELAADDENIRTLNDYLGMTRSKAGIGVATDFDALTIEVKLAEAQSVRANGAGELAKSRIDLARLLGLENSGKLELAGDLSPDGKLPEAGGIVRFGLEHNPGLKAADARERSSRESARAAQRRYFPSLNAGFQYGKQNGYDPDMNRLVWNSTGFIKLEMPLFDLDVIGARREAAADQKAAAAARRGARDGVAADIERALLDVNADKAKMDAEKLHLALAEKAEQQAKVRYEGGMSTGLDLLNVQADLSRARSLYLRSVYEFILARASLKKAAGIPQLGDPEGDAL